LHTSSKISRAKAKLLVDYPLFGTIASKLELIINDDIEAFKSDGIKLEYNSDFFKNIAESQIEFALANGAMHASLSHESRKSKRSSWLWQMATDFAINDMLVENGLDCPPQAHYRVRFKGMYAEEIYAELKDDMLRDDELQYPSDDEVQDNSQNNKKQDLQEIEQSSQLFEEFSKSIIEEELKHSEIPKGFDRFFNLNLDVKIDWRDELRVALDRFHKDDYTLFPPNKKLLYMGMYLPSSSSERFKLVVAVDSSGSIDENLLNIFLSELNFLMNTIPNYELDLLICDDKIRDRKTFYSGDVLEVNLQGGGATDFRPVFDFIDKELPDTSLLLYFSDLDGIFPKDEPLYVVKWVSSKDVNPAFGEVIFLDSYS
jgi:predicted metal-dependent peptidase